MHRLMLVASVVASFITTVAVQAQTIPVEKSLGTLETVATFNGPMPTGVTVSKKGRIFVNFPRWGDQVPATVCELVNGKVVAFPDAAIQQARTGHLDQGLVSVQSVVVDSKDRLWLLDTGSVKFGPTSPGGPKLICVDLNTTKILKKILFPPSVALRTSYLNDVRFDLSRGRDGFAYITDSSGNGPNGIVVVDLASGQSWRKLHNHSSTKAESHFLPVVEGRPVMTRLSPSSKPAHIGIGSDGIAISADHKRLYYCPLSSRRLYSVSVDALSTKGGDASRTVIDHGDKGGAADGLESDADGNVYATNYEHNAILRRKPNGEFETVVHDPRLLWPDTLSVANDGYLYVIANQIHRQANFQNGRDLREKPYSLMRVQVGARPLP